MNLYAPGTFTGNYATSSAAEVAQADYVIGHEFASREEGYGSVNEALAEVIAERYAHLRIYAAATVAGALRNIAPEIELAGVFDGVSSNTTASQGGTWGELLQAKEMAGDAAQRPLLVGQAYHVGRIALQAKKAGLEPIVPAGLPTDFDKQSAQWWCRRPLAWGMREIPGALVLRKRGQL